MPDADLLTPPEPSRLRALSIQGGAAAFVAQVAQFVVAVATTMILARLLTPEDFGLLAMVAAPAGLLTLVGDLGLSQATVQREKISQAEVSGLFWVNALLGVVVAVLMVPVAFALVGFYGEPRVAAITIVYGVLFVPTALSVQHRALLQRRMDFRILARISVGAGVAGSVAAMLAAWAGLGYWSLLVLPGVTAAVTLASTWLVTGWTPNRPQRVDDLGSLLRFGGYLSGFNLVNYGARNADNLLIGWRWGAEELGFYSKAYSLLLLPLQQINGPVGAVALPVLSRLHGLPESRERFKRAFSSYMGLLTRLTLPVVAGLIILAPEVCLLVLGPQWVASADIFRFLGLASLFQVVTNPLGALMISTGRTDRMFWLAAVNTPLTLAVFALGLPRGGMGVAVAYAAYNAVIFLPTVLYISRGSPLSIGEILRPVVPSVATAALVAGALLGARALIPEAWPLLARVAVAGSAAAVVWSGANAFVFKKDNPARLLRELRDVP
jgi:PST family polysaccharide transporter